MPSQTEEPIEEAAADEQTNGAAEEQAQQEDEAEQEPEPMCIRVLPGSSDTAASFEFVKEDHTLGNALRYIIMKNPVVEFCGYSIPHPSEERMNMRIQTYDKASVYDVLEKGLEDLMELCDVVVDKFTIARDEFNAEKSAAMETA